MNIYDLTNITNVFFCGGSNTECEDTLLRKLQDGMSVGIDVTLHPKEIERQQRIGKRRASRGRSYSAPPSSFKTRGNGKFDNAAIFVSGGFGFGSKDDSFFQEILGKVNEICEKNGSHVMFVRGSSDDPSYFTEHKFDFSNVKLLEDYTIVKLNGFDCLCIGGSIPIDRQWRIEQQKRVGRQLYFENCNTTLDKELLSGLLDKNNVTCIITSDAPTFISPYADEISDSKWVENDKSIIRDITEQRMIMDAIYGEMMCLSKKPFVWCSYGRYDDSSVVNKIKFISSSSSYTMYNLQEAAIETFGTMLNGEKANSSKNAKVKLKKMSVDDGRTAPVAAGNNLGRPMNVIQVPHHEPEPAAPHWYEAQLNEDALRYDDPDPGVGNLEHPEEDNGVPDGFRRFVARINQRDNAQRGAENIRQVFDHLGMANINTEDLRRELSEEDINQISELVRRYGVEEAAATIARGIGENGNVTVDANGNLAIDIG